MIVAEVGTGGGASQIVIPLDIAATATGASLFVHGRFVWNKSIQNTKDTLQKIQSSGGGKGASNRIPSYGKDSVPKGPYREVNGYPIKVKAGAQEKHIPDTPNYKQELANGKNKSIFYGDNKIAQELLDKFAGKGELLKNGRERVDFCEPIGKYYDRNTGEYYETTKGLIHYGKDGAHIVPSRP
ncbi:TPA: transposase [Bacillus cereus]|nr:transposase [Bacillus cereus]HDR8393180.1 transposase [Bacillus cereus]HDR8399685.1 transposase [Bacillus cereus]HDR8404993.1 transposase [Bacillus cereus]